MIKSLRISNYQSHKDSYLEFSDGVNIILGHSDSGKSAILRAFRWLTTNKPAGDSFRSSWGGKTQVEMFTDDAHIVRSRDNENEYILGDTHFKAFSTDVPKEISDALNLNGTNLQAQLDAPYLLSETPGDVAAHWNRIAHLEAIDKGTNNINSAIREINSDIKYKTAEEVKLIEQLKTYEYLDAYEQEVEVLEEMERQKTKLANSVNKLHAVTSAYRLTDANLKEKSEVLKSEQIINEVLSLIDQKKKVEDSFNRLYGLEADILRNEEGIKHLNETLTMEKPVSEILGLINSKKIASERHTKLSQLLSSIKGISDRIVKGVSYIASQEAVFEKEMPDICPLCNQKIIR